MVCWRWGSTDIQTNEQINNLFDMHEFEDGDESNKQKPVYFN